jgi:alkanesulfonate monooxygenase SsuD/methylene tetrahydromethanopterin reductase-like flavin-dependent oxidoreductase (luciferase family)
MAHFGIYSGGVMPLDQLTELARHAEACGFHGWFCTEHHQQAGINPSPLAVLAALAGRTERMKLGTAVLLPALYHPVRLAADAAVVDGLSGGRLILGAGLGYQPVDFDAFGIPIANRVSLFEEGIEILKLAWEQDRVSFNGRRYRLHDISVVPKPAQQPRPPIWLAGWTAPGVRRAARLGDAWLTDPIVSLEATLSLKAELEDEARIAGTSPAIALMRPLAVGDTRSGAFETYGTAAVYSYRYYWRNGAMNAGLEPWLRDVTDESELTWENLSRDRVIFGTPDDCAADIERWFGATGSEWMIFSISPGPGRDRMQATKDAMTLFGREVIPAFA